MTRRALEAKARRPARSVPSVRAAERPRLCQQKQRMLHSLSRVLQLKAPAPRPNKSMDFPGRSVTEGSVECPQTGYAVPFLSSVCLALAVHRSMEHMFYAAAQRGPAVGNQSGNCWSSVRPMTGRR